MSCKCIIQSGARAGLECGRKSKENGKCGVHKTTCVGAKRSPVKKVDYRKSPAKKVDYIRSPSKMPLLQKTRSPSRKLDPRVKKYINKIVLSKDITKIGYKKLGKQIKEKFGADIGLYEMHIMQIIEKKEAAEKRCENMLDDLKLFRVTL